MSDDREYIHAGTHMPTLSIHYSHWVGGGGRCVLKDSERWEVNRRDGWSRTSSSTTVFHGQMHTSVRPHRDFLASLVTAVLNSLTRLPRLETLPLRHRLAARLARSWPSASRRAQIPSEPHRGDEGCYSLRWARGVDALPLRPTPPRNVRFPKLTARCGNRPGPGLSHGICVVLSEIG